MKSVFLQHKSRWGGILVLLFSLLSATASTCPKCHHDPCTCHGNSTGKKGGGVGVGISIDLDKVGKRKKEPDPFDDPPNTVIQIDGEGTPVKPPAAAPHPKHHCQAGRLIIVIGPFDSKYPENPAKNTDRLSRIDTDPTIGAVLKWTRELDVPHVHRVAYSAGRTGDNPSLINPYEPNDKNDWSKAGSKLKESKRTDAAISQELAEKWNDCCYYQEVLIFVHGSQTGFNSLLENLPRLLGGKPVRKLVFWSCRSTDKLMPGEDFYKKLGGVIAPKACPCECDPATCKTVLPAPGPKDTAKCPSATDNTILLTSWHMKGRSVKLGWENTPPNFPNRPFGTPDGKMREITIHPGGKMTVDEVQDPSVFAGRQATTTTNPDLFIAEKEKTVDLKALTKTTDYILPSKETKYPGPKVCEEGEGCFLNKVPATK